MDMLLLGEMITAAASNQTHTGFWMPAAGNNGVAGIEVYFQSAASGFTLHMDTKSSDEADPATPVSIGSVALTGTAAATYKFDLANAKDLVRYRLVSNKAGTLHFQFAQPLWHPN